MYELNYILQLLQSFDYETALNFYATHEQADSFLVKLFQRNQTEFNANELKKELKNILKKYQEEEAIEEKVHQKKVTQAQKKVEGKATTPETATTKPHFYFQQYNFAPKEIQEIVKSIKLCYKEKDYLFGQLAHYQTDEERRVAAMKILDLADQIKEDFEHLERFDKTKKIPIKNTNKEIETINLEDLYMLRNRYRVYTSRAKDKPEEYKKWKEKLETVENKINAFQ